MQQRFFLIVSGTVLLMTVHVASSSAEDRIHAFLGSNGRVVFTNLVDNEPLPPFPAPAPKLADTTNVLAEGIPATLRALVDTISTNHGVDADLVRAMIKTESNFNRWAVSNKGALGLMQLIPSTGRRFGVRDFFDPQQNVDGGVRYLKFLLEKFNGNLDLSLAAYNAGENLVQRLGQIPPIPETTNYVRKVRAIYQRKSGLPASVVTPVVAAASAAMVATAEPPQQPEPAKIFKIVDARGVTHFSNIEPPN